MLVVLGHTHPSFNKFIYGFHMPLFFILSGYLYKRKTSREYFTNMFGRLIIPYFILTFINLLVQISWQAIGLQKGSGVLKYLFGIVWSLGNFGYMPNCTPLWFLTCLFLSMNFFNLINTKFAHAVKCIIFLTCFVVGVKAGQYLFEFQIQLPWNFDLALMALLFIEYGNWINRINVIEKLNKFNYCYTFVICAVLAIAGFIMINVNHVKMVDFNGRTFGNPLIMVVGAITVSTSLIFTFAKFPLFGSNKILQYLGRHTIFIMGFDYFCGTIVRFILKILLTERIWIVEFTLKMLMLLLGIFVWNGIVKSVSNERLQKILSLH